MKNKIEFIAEVREVKSKKLITNDLEYKVVFNSDNPIILELARIPADQLVKVTVETHDG